MKKEYLMPETDILHLAAKQSILDVSGGVSQGENINTEKNTYGDAWVWGEE